jgi:acetylornithine deacetylase/succinyl-diaminopimelate desuccinylase-like protein
MGAVPQGFAARVGPHPHVQPDDRSDPLERRKVDPGCQAALDPAELRHGDASSIGYAGQRQPGRVASSAEFVAESQQEPPRSAVAAGHAGLRHRGILANRAHPGLNGKRPPPIDFRAMPDRTADTAPNAADRPATDLTAAATDRPAPEVAGDLDAYLEPRREERLERLKAFLRIPSISALPDHAPDVRRAAEWLADELRAAGIENVEVSETGGHPIVYGDWLHADGAPTVVVYGHYDVQPIDPLDEWHTQPFEPVVEGDRLIGRGAADDKGQIHAHVAAAAALLATRGRLPINVRYVFEGEEESASVHLDAWLDANRHRLTADAAIISDTGFHEGNIPAITLSLRGMMYAQIDVRLAAGDLHSGSYGGAVANPAFALAQIVSALKGPDGRVRIPGFYDAVREPTQAERDAIAALPFDEEAFRAQTGTSALVGESGYSTLERKSIRPTLEVNGIWGGFQGEGQKTIIPAVAHAKVSTRLVADQDPDDIFERLKAFVEAIAPPGVAVTVRHLGKGSPSQTELDHPYIRAASAGLHRAFGKPPVYIRSGGSIPIAASFQRILGLSVVLQGFTQPEDLAHAPNEWFDLANYEGAIRAIAATFEEIAAL